MKNLTFYITLTFFILGFTIPNQAQTLSPWKKGYLDIHQISTGRGNAAFLILPDGTTMLIDAGDLGDTTKFKQTILPAFPDNTKLPGEWIARYVSFFSKPLKKERLYYVLLTHYHDDHIGGPSSKSLQPEGRNYRLCGIAEVAEYIPIRKLVDRNWPDFDYPSRKSIISSNPNFNNYLNFLHYQENDRKTNIERFEVGSDTQFKLLHQPDKYPNFNIRNIYSSGRIWTGNGNGAIDLFPAIDSLQEKEYPSENMCSSVIKITYGNFTYYSGGDISVPYNKNFPEWRDMETPVSRLVGPVDVAVANHHAYSDAMTEAFISYLRPQAFIIPVWDFYHPQPEVLARMTDKKLYPEKRLIFATGMVPENMKRLGEPAKKIQPAGHIVVRVFPGGDHFKIFVLDAQTVNHEILYESELLTAKRWERH